MSADSHAGNMVFFGGFDLNTVYGDTWTWDGRDWSNHPTSTQPSARVYATAAFDPAINKVVLFGGTFENYAALADTWAWDGSAWSQLSPSTSPPARFASSMVYDPALGKIVLFGGVNDGATADYADTWTFDGTNWAPVTIASPPASRYGHQIAYDAEASRVILFGGNHCTTGCTDAVALPGTYGFDGSSWTPLTTTSEPGPRSQHVMSYDASTRQVVLFGGLYHTTSSDTTLGDTWVWQGGDWHRQPGMPGPAARELATAAFSPEEGQFVVFGGWNPSGGVLGDTWVFSPYTAVSNRQYSLAGSDGATWLEIDPALRVTLTPEAGGSAEIGGNADLWTERAGYNQDLAIFLSDNGGADRLLAWKESGGFAGTFSPNAAFIQVPQAVTAGHTYVFKLMWKTNRAAAPGVRIHAGAGPLSDGFSPTRLTVDVVPNGVRTDSTAITSQPSLANSNGTDWQEIDPTLRVTAAPGADATAVIGANGDLWTETQGFNQDLGIFASDGGSPDELLAWKESGGFAGTFSPNAAFVQAAHPLASGHTYVFKLKWKSNHSGTSIIHAGAGPIGGLYSPTRLTVEQQPTGAVETRSSTLQYALAGSDGLNWQEVAPALRLTLSPVADGTAILGANADLWTENAGFNQDLGIFISDNGGPDVLLGWKESGGFAGTFSPNAAFVQATSPLAAGHSYTVKLKWKTNRNGPGAVIHAGAGPLGDGTFSPTRLSVEMSS